MSGTSAPGHAPITAASAFCYFFNVSLETVFFSCLFDAIPEMSGYWVRPGPTLAYNPYF